MTLDATQEAVAAAVAEGARTYFIFCTVSSILATRDDPTVKSAFEGAELVLPDGMPLVWLGRASGHRVERVYGPDLMLEVLADAKSGLSHFFYGGAPGIADEMARRLEQRFPHLKVAGSLAPKRVSGRSVAAEDVEQINAAGADVVWVGLGHPKQELWMQTHRPHLEAPVLAGVGAAFDFFSGRKNEAPAWMKRSGLQWAHRLASDPRRLWKRYLIGNPRFLILLARERIGLGRS